jgi:Superinfection immunity protein
MTTMKPFLLTFLASVALVAPLRAETNVGDIEKMSPQEFSQMLDRNLGATKTDPAPEPTPALIKFASARPSHVADQKPNDTGAGSAAFVIILLGIALVVYFFPSFVGGRKRNAGAIFVLNLFCGWSFIGWIIALVWACTSEPLTRDAQAPKLKEKLLRAHA